MYKPGSHEEKAIIFSSLKSRKDENTLTEAWSFASISEAATSPFYLTV